MSNKSICLIEANHLPSFRLLIKIIFPSHQGERFKVDCVPEIRKTIYFGERRKITIVAVIILVS